MSNTFSPLRILLVQARTIDDPMRAHELAAFARRTELEEACFRIFNVATDSVEHFTVDDIDCVMVGGSGAFSVVDGGFDWHEGFLNIMRDLVRRRVPTFASCFGFQALVQALGGELKKDVDKAELGTHELSLTEQGKSDSLFGRLPERFDAQFGHNDSAVVLPEDLLHLAQTPRCPYQAVRVKGAPIVATQFHPELDMSGNLDRFQNYLEHYKSEGQDFEQAMAYARSIHRPSPRSGELLRFFIEEVATSK